MRTIRVMTAALAAALALGVATAQAAEIKVMSSTGVRSVLEVLVPEFEKASGHKVVIDWNTAANLKGKIDKGETFDVAILTAPLIDKAIAEGKVVAATKAAIAHAGLGLAVKAGAPKPDIGTAEAFKRTLLAAKSVSYTTTGASGTYFVHLTERLGIADAVKAKAKTLPGGPIAELVARGESEMAVQLVPELRAVPGVEVVPLPAELQDYIVLTGGVGTGAKQPQAGAALMKFLTAPSAVPVIKSKFMEPGAG